MGASLPEICLRLRRLRGRARLAKPLRGATVRRVKFRPGLRQTLTANAAYLGAMSPDGVLPADLQASLERTMPAPKKSRAAPRALEAPVVAAISELLAVHPKVLFACRQNSGMASYEAKSGKYAPVFFYRILTHNTLTITDFWGILRDGRMFAIEAKAPGFKRPSGEREFRQAAFLQMVSNCGGIGIFATSADQVAEILK